MGKNKNKKIEEQIIAELENLTPGTPEYKAVLENLTNFRKSLEETRASKAKEENEKEKLELEKKKLDIDQERNDIEREKMTAEAEKAEAQRKFDAAQQELNREANKKAAKMNAIFNMISAGLQTAGHGIVAFMVNIFANQRLAAIVRHENDGTFTGVAGTNVAKSSINTFDR